MNNLINIQTARRERRQTEASGITLYQSGFHQMADVKDQSFKVHAMKFIKYLRYRVSKVQPV